MNDSPTPDMNPPSGETQNRRLFLQGMGKWSGAAIVAAVAGTFAGTTPEARAGAWINRRGGWINRAGGGGWVNRARGGGAWINGGGGGGGWVNRRLGGGGGWINRR